jgi:DNA modification methylase
VTLYQGDALEVLRTLPDESVHMACTSPPFYGLRDYGTGTWEGGDGECDHAITTAATRSKLLSSSTLQGGKATVGRAQEGYPALCARCGARRVDQQIGLEATPEEWVARLVEVFREVRRVLRKDGTLWLEIGDSYNGSGGYAPDAPINKRREQGEGWGKFNPASKEALASKRGIRLPRISTHPCAACRGTGEGGPGGELCVSCAGAGVISVSSPLKPKDLIGAPWLLAFALRADGWYLRSEIIWSKPNPMPESVTDRPKTSHRRVFLLTKSPRYFYDAEAIREPHHPDGRTVTRHPGPGEYSIQERSNGDRWPGTGRSRRSVWTIATEPYPEAHFATWPQKLVEPMILAGTAERGVVLDPFAGSGTTLHVARRLGRRAIGIELSAEYCALAARRLSQLSLLGSA